MTSFEMDVSSEMEPSGLYIEGPVGSGKTGRLVAESLRILAERDSTALLILCSNHARQKQFLRGLLSRLTVPQAQIPVYTYAGYVRNQLFNFWPLAETRIQEKIKDSQPQIVPVLSGLEDSELIFKALLYHYKKQCPQAFSEFPGTEQGLLKQLIRRLRLRSENRLSREEMTRRSVLLQEICIPDAEWMIREFDRLSYRLRVLDANKQLDVFHGLLTSCEIFRAHITKTVGCLIVDDVDETIPAQQAFIQFLAPHVERLVLAADLDGGSRRGYLNAYPYDWEALKSLQPGRTIQLDRQDMLYKSAQALLENWKRKEIFKPLDAVRFRTVPMTRLEMLEQVVQDIQQSVRAGGYQPGDLSIVLPKTDPLTTYYLKHHLLKRGIPVQFLFGTRRPIENIFSCLFVYLLQLLNFRKWRYAVSPVEWKTVITKLLKTPVHHLTHSERILQILSTYFPMPGESLIPSFDKLLEGYGGIIPVEGEDFTTEKKALETFRHHYEQLFQWLSDAENWPFDRQIYGTFSQMIAPAAGRQEKFQEKFDDLRRIIESYDRARVIFMGLVEENIVSGEGRDSQAFNRLWLGQIKSGSVADTPDMIQEVDPNAVIIGTPQKIIDFEVSRKIQHWLDVHSQEWARTDNAPLYNAWVHSAVWDETDPQLFTEEFKEAIIRTRAAHITRTLMLYAREAVRAYGSELDNYGFTQNGPLQPRLMGQEKHLDLKAFMANIPRAVLRLDQQPILKYRKGTMAITAVPGAGKTFVNVELILELIKQGFPPESILVLTYMDSAAKTLLQRLKKKLAGVSAGMPLISTIHSLALKILKDNDHALAFRFLPNDIEILDPYDKEELLLQTAERVSEIEKSQEISGGNQGSLSRRVLERGISHAKTRNIQPIQIESFLRLNPKAYKLKKFLPTYQLYQQRLSDEGKLDFDDLVHYAVRLLEENTEICDYYRKQFNVIIEDEAQDSSHLLQRFIALLSSDAANIIRTGDTNQSITTTFTAADTSVFRDFIHTADHVVRMDQSSRCAPEVIALANHWMTEISKRPGLENAFEIIEMKPVPDWNPSLLYPLTAKLFDRQEEEEDWIVGEIAGIRSEYPEASIAVLVTNNEQAAGMAGKLQQAGLPAVSLGERLNIHPVFCVLLRFLRLLENPQDTLRQIALYDAMVEAHLTPFHPERRLFLETYPVLTVKPNTLPGNDEFLMQFYYDCLDFLRAAIGGDIVSLLIRMTDRLFSTVEDRSNGYLCALYAEEAVHKHYRDCLFLTSVRVEGGDPHIEPLSPLEIVTGEFTAYYKSKAGKNGFVEIIQQRPHHFIQVMTLHKSKGQEFDIVLIPFLTPYEMLAGEDEQLIRELDCVKETTVLGNPDKNEGDQKEKPMECLKLEERARLLYVGITRAKRGLMISSHLSGKEKRRSQKKAPSSTFLLLETLIRQIQANQPQRSPIGLPDSNPEIIPPELTPV